MGNSLRCCLACVIPCGALDLIRIVHLNGYVQEITTPVSASDILNAYPDHVLSNPCSEGLDFVPRIRILHPDSQLKKGGIYFLLPDPKSGKKKTQSKISKQQVLLLPHKNSKSSTREHISNWMPHLESIPEDSTS